MGRLFGRLAESYARLPRRQRLALGLAGVAVALLGPTAAERVNAGGPAPRRPPPQEPQEPSQAT